MEENRQKVKEIILNAEELNFSEKEEMAWLFDSATEEEVKAGIELFSEDSSWIKKMADNYFSKKIAFLADDVDMWKKILETEKDLIKNG